jgi:hypothetical protein
MDSPFGPTDSQAVEASLTADSTEPQPAPERRPTPIVPNSKRTAERSRRATLVSPIPALMAASMRDTVGSAKPLDERDGIPVVATAQSTARLEQLDEEALRFEAEADYVVEIDASKKNG